MSREAGHQVNRAGAPAPDASSGFPLPLPYPDSSAPIQPFTAELVAPTPERVRGEVDVQIAPTETVIHPDLPAVPAWGYSVNGGPVTSPGPLLEVRADDPVTISWHNRLGKSGLPFLAWKTTDSQNADGDSPQTDPGITAPGSAGAPQDQTGKPIGLTVTHLHGGHTIPDSDGWPDSMMATNGRQVCRYDNDSDSHDLGLLKRGPMQWYHDHAMGGTGQHVYAGLAGPYLVRDPREHALGLPCTPDTGESVLMITDRNIVDDAESTPAAAGGPPSVRFLHKITPDTAEFFGPLTLVGGKLWPTLRVGPGVIRLRLYGVGNSRVFRLHLLDDELDYLDLARLRVIGSDGGLLWRAQPVDVHAGITLAPAERVDLLVDLRGHAAGSRLYLVNSAQAPFDGLAPSEPVTASRPSDRIGFPQVMSLLVDDEAPKAPHDALWDEITTRVLNPDFRRVIHTDPVAGDAPQISIEGHDHHPVLLVENPAGHLTLQEVVHATPDQQGNLPPGSVTLQFPNDPQPVAYQPVNPAPTLAGPTGNFYGTLGISAEVGRWQVFSFLNTTVDAHPIHIHQSEFQPVNDHADVYDIVTDSNGNLVSALPTHNSGRDYEPQERLGWKDTIRVYPQQLVSVAIRFDLLGRYVYHCHILEHEDNEMMRPFLVVPAGMTPSMGMSMGAPNSEPHEGRGPLPTILTTHNRIVLGRINIRAAQGLADPRGQFERMFDLLLQELGSRARSAGGSGGSNADEWRVRLYNNAELAIPADDQLLVFSVRRVRDPSDGQVVAIDRRGRWLASALPAWLTPRSGMTELHQMIHSLVAPPAELQDAHLSYDADLVCSPERIRQWVEQHPDVAEVDMRISLPNPGTEITDFQKWIKLWGAHSGQVRMQAFSDGHLAFGAEDIDDIGAHTAAGNASFTIASRNGAGISHFSSDESPDGEYIGRQNNETGLLQRLVATFMPFVRRTRTIDA